MSYDYGNARLRAARSGLLDRRRYTELLLTGSIDRLLGALHDSPYAESIEWAIARYRGLRRLDEAIRSHLASSLGAIAGYYDGDAGHWVAVLLRRWDVKNVRTLLRAKAGRVPVTDFAASLVPIGSIDQTSLTELAAAPSMRELVDLLVVRRLPNRSVAMNLFAVWPDYDRSGDVAVLERALEAAWASALADALGGAPEPLRRALTGEVDAINLVAAVRLYEERSRTGDLSQTSLAASPYLPGGRLRPEMLDAVVWATDRPAVVATVEGRGPSGWTPALAGWAEHGDPVVLEHELRAAIARVAVGFFTTADPLGMGIPVAYAWAKEIEAANLRLIGRTIVHRLPAEQVEALLVVAA